MSEVYGPPVPPVLEARAAHQHHRHRARLFRALHDATISAVLTLDAIAQARLSEDSAPAVAARDREHAEQAAAGAFAAGILYELADDEDEAAAAAYGREVDEIRAMWGVGA
jgi:hypothetical protein